jgi:hypothetical protein
MTTTQIIVIAAVLAIVVALAARGWGGARVTTIETRRERDKDGDDSSDA